MRNIRLNGSSITVLAVVKGLTSEADAVERAYGEVRPDAIAVSISREELTGLRNREDYDRYEPSDLEIIYQAFLERFGEVRLPPPAFVRALEISERDGAAILPLDMNDEVYTEAYCQSVSTSDMIRESLFARRATGRHYDLTDPIAFARSWDAKVNRASGFRELEEAREKHMAEALRNLGRRYHNILAVVECERSDGVVAILENGAGSAAPALPDS
ncbi:MAG: hypothetical protein ISF22_11480 [Methanomassiliicoccus sp.]|nr:hypothetical protein [Methanomassiliicoccus sp.]